MAAHSPTPWTSGSSAIFAGKKCIGVTDCDSNAPNIEHANAAFIVRAVNAHDELVAALKEAIAFAEADVALAGGQEVSSVTSCDLNKGGELRTFSLDAARAALRKAEAL